MDWGEGNDHGARDAQCRGRRARHDRCAVCGQASWRFAFSFHRSHAPRGNAAWDAPRPVQWPWLVLMTNHPATQSVAECVPT
ncbi:MAG: hypothetical protein EPN21_11345 [Methylococcaceae bacterium]|nr:MAG: hypothetical protein EPN21_11345 [Methylococcaceae bacterium]